MAKKNFQKQMVNNALAMTTTGVIMGVGAGVATQVGGKALPGAAGGIQAMSGFMPAMGSVAGAGMAMGMLGQMSNAMPMQKGKKRKY